MTENEVLSAENLRLIGTKIAEATVIRPDFPKAGINFVDFLPLFSSSPQLMSELLSTFRRALQENEIEAVAGIEARGFVFGAALATTAELPFLALRKPGKTPPPFESYHYETEYSNDGLELQAGLFTEGARVALVDDILATGGTSIAALHLLRKAGAKLPLSLFVGELSSLGGQAAIKSAGFSDMRTLVLHDYVS